MPARRARTSSRLHSLGGVEDILGNLKPIFPGLNAGQTGRRLAHAKKDFHHAGRESFFPERFLQVVNEMGATGFPDEPNLLPPRRAEMNAVRPKPHARRIEI